MSKHVQAFDISKVPYQKGSALLVSLVMLLLISIIAVGAMQGSILQERMSANLHDRELAFQAAEAALRDAEQQLRVQDANWRANQVFIYQINGTNLNGDAPPDWFVDPQIATGFVGTMAANIQGVARQPDYYIEELNSPVGGTSTELGVEDLGAAIFRISARGFGGTQQTVVLVRSVYRTR